MRVTLNMLYGNNTRYVNANLEKYYKLQEALLTEKRINRPSDDPVGTSRALDMRKLLGDYDQFARNITTAQGYIEQTDVALASIVERLQRAIELTVDINDSTVGADELQGAAAEMEDIFQEVLRQANTKYADQYIFAGFETSDPPFDDTGNYVGGVDQEIKIEISKGEYLTINFTGDDVFKNGTDVLQVLQDAAAAIASGDHAAITTQLGLLRDSLDQVLNFETQNGARSNRLDVAEEDNIELSDSFTAILSSVEDIDLTTVSSQFALQEQALEASRLVASSVMSQNFLDFFV